MSRGGQNERVLVSADRAAKAIFPRIPAPVDVTDTGQFPLIAEAAQHYASLSPERRAQLEKEWEG